MKRQKLLIALLLISVFPLTKAQDSTSISFIHANRELSLLNSLNNIQYTGFTCNDTTARGKRFLVHIEEYVNGEKIPCDSADLQCKEELIPMEVNEKTVQYRFDPCSRKTFPDEENTFTVALAGKLEADTFRLFIDYPAIRLSKKLKGSTDYSLRPISCDSGDKATIPIGKLTPVFAYTPPFDTQKGMSSYCILGTENVGDWFRKFGLKHYYILYVIIEL